MDTLFISIAVSFSALVAFDFVSGLWELWQKAGATKTPIKTPGANVCEASIPATEIPDPWFEPLEMVPIIVRAQEPAPKAQFLLLPAVFPRESKYWMKADELLSKSIRQLKAIAKERKIRNYGSFTKNQLVEALLTD